MRCGKIIKRYRITNERTLRDLGKEIGISAPTLLRLEDGNDVDSKTLTKLLAWLLEVEPKK